MGKVDDILSSMTNNGSTDFSKQDILQLLDTGLKENQPFAKYFTETILKDLQRKMKDIKIQSTAIQIDGKTISKEINDGIRNGLEKDIDKTVDTIRKEITDAGKDVSKGADKSSMSLSSILGQTPAMSKFTQMRFQGLTRTILNKIEKGLPNKIELGAKDGVKLGDIFSTSGKDKIPSISMWLKWNKLQKDTIDKISKGLPTKIELGAKDGIKLGDIFSTSGKDSIPSISMWLKWNKLQKDILDKLSKKTSNITIGEKDGITLSSIMGVAPNAGPLTYLKWTSLQRSILTKLTKKTSNITIGEKDGITLSSIMGAAPSAGPLTYLKWTSLQRSILTKLSEQTEDMQLGGKNGITLSSIMGAAPNAGPLTYLKWTSLQRSILTKLSEQTEDMQLGGKNGISVNDVMGTPPSAGFLTQMRWGKLQRAILDKMIKKVNQPEEKPEVKTDVVAVKETPKKKEKKEKKDEVVNKVTETPKKERNALGQFVKKEAKADAPPLPAVASIAKPKEFKSLEEKDPEVKIGGFTKEALKDLSNLPGMKGLGHAPEVSKKSDNGGGLISSAIEMLTGGKGGAGMLKLAASSVGKMLTPLLAKLPLIGSILNFAWAFTAFKSNDIKGGALKLAAGLAGLIPGIGVRLMLGIDVIAGFRDATTSKEERAKEGASGGIAKVKLMGALAMKMGAKFLKFIKFIPFLGSVLSFVDAYKMFKGGNYLKGILSLASGIAGFIPGIGTAIGIGLDVINMFISEKKEAPTEVKSGEKPKGFFASIKDWIADKLKGLWKKVPKIFKTLLKFTPMGWAISAMLGDKKEDENKGPTEQTPSAPTEKKPKSIFETIKEMVSDKLKKAWKHMPWWIKKVVKYLPGMSSILKSIGVEDGKDDSSEASPSDTKPKGNAPTKPVESSKDQANDFIWRKGATKAQKFSSDDNIISTKNNKIFEQMVDVLKGGQNTDQQLQASVKKLIIKIDQLMNTIGKQNNTASSQPPQGMLSGIESSTEIRDPAYVLRSRAWDRIRKGYVVI